MMMMMKRTFTAIRSPMRSVLHLLLLLLLVVGAVAQMPIPCTGPSVGDPSACRLIITSNLVYALPATSFFSDYPYNDNRYNQSHILMRFDAEDDPTFQNALDIWISLVDTTGQTSYDYTRAWGCLGSAGPLGATGPLSFIGNLPNRHRGKGTLCNWTIDHHWCPNSTAVCCVYDACGPLGEDGPLNPLSYYQTMYHLGTGINWQRNYNHNLDAAGVWGILGPLGPLGALGPLGPLGPFGVGLQCRVDTDADGQYRINGTVVRQTPKLQYRHDNSRFRVYDLYEMYSKSFALTMPDNDCSFAVDSSYEDPPSPSSSSSFSASFQEGDAWQSGTTVTGDMYFFQSRTAQFVSINIVPLNALATYSLTLLSDVTCSGNFSVLAMATSNALSVANGGLMNFIVARTANLSSTAAEGQVECLAVQVQLIQSMAPIEAGYYLFVTGTQLQELDEEGDVLETDVWGPRMQLHAQRSEKLFNILGPHQSWIQWNW